jgi:uncharacterized protein (DUF1330 family)
LDSGVLLVVQLHVRPGREAQFRQFETEAARIMRRHGGRIERVIRVTAAAPGSAMPHEVHAVAFPSLERFEAYRADPDLARLASLRQSAIARTDVVIGQAGEAYLVD